MPAKSRIRKAVLPVAGLGTRFWPATKAIPKEMLPIVDTPAIQFIVEEAVQSGIEEIIFVTSAGKESIAQHFALVPQLEKTFRDRGLSELADGCRKLSELAKFTFVMQSAPLGLGHAVLTAAAAVGDEPFAVMLGDEIMHGSPPCLQELIQTYESRQVSTVAIMEVAPEAVSRYGIVDGSELSPGLIQIKTLVEKPKPESAPSRWAIPGRYVFSPKIFSYLEQTGPGVSGEIQLTDAMIALARSEGILGKTFSARRFDTGEPLGMIEAVLYHASQRPELRAGLRQILESARSQVNDGTASLMKEVKDENIF